MGTSFVDPDLHNHSGSSHSSFGLISQVLRDGTVQILVLDCVEEARHQGRELTTKLELPGGTGLTGEKPEATLGREVSAEISKEGKPLPIAGSLLIEKFEKPGDKEKGGGIHTQYFFFVELSVDASRLELRIGKKTEADGAILGPPHWMDAEKFFESLIAKRNHRIAVRKFVVILSKKRREVAGRYSRFFAT